MSFVLCRHRNSLWEISCLPVWIKMAARTLCPPLWPKMPGPWQPTALTHSSTGWFHTQAQSERRKCSPCTVERSCSWLTSLGEGSHSGSARQTFMYPVWVNLCARMLSLSSGESSPSYTSSKNRRTISGLNPLHMVMTHSEQQVWAGDNCTMTTSGVQLLQQRGIRTEMVASPVKKCTKLRLYSASTTWIDKRFLKKK